MGSSHRRIYAAGAAALLLTNLLISTSAAAAVAPSTQPTTQPAASLAGSANHSLSTATTGDAFSGMSIEDLMNVQVTSVAKQPQKASESPAAVTVITSDDIARSGFQTVPDLLRLSPGMDVAQLNANTWAIGARGFNDIYSNKLLVLNDGRSVYTPMFSGVFWDLQEPLLQDLDRIEVIRGPGATLYGSNAVDGVVNITSKSAKDTQGWFLSGLGGSQQQSGAVRFGDQIDSDTYFRVYSTYRKFDDFPTADGNDGRDGWQGYSGGFRIDKYATSADTFTLQGDVESNREGQTVQVQSFVPPYMALNYSSFNAVGADVLGRWTHTFSDTADLSVQAYYDHVDHPIELCPYKADTGDLSVHDRFAPLADHELIVGADYRYWNTTFGSGPLAVVTSGSRDDYLVSGFAQDDWTVVHDRLHLIAGTELEETSLGGFDVQPTGRLLWTPNDRNTLWTSVSRAVRTPSVWERDAAIITPAVPEPGAPLPVQQVIHGDSTFTSETEMSYQIGYRIKPWKTFSIDANASYNHYSDIRSFEASIPTVVYAPAPHLVLPVGVGNSLAADTYTIEVAGNWQVTPSWRLSASYSFLAPHAYNRGVAGAPDAAEVALLNGGSPKNQAQLHSYWDITRNIQLNASIYYSDQLVAEAVPSYIRTDVNVNWRPRPNLDVTLGVQNAFDNRHPEYSATTGAYTQGTEVPRSIYGQVTYRF